MKIDLIVTSSYPEHQGRIPRNASIKVYFSDHLKVDCITSDNFQIIDADFGEVVPTRLSWLPSQQAVIIRPNDYLRSDRRYLLIVKGKIRDYGTIISRSNSYLQERYLIEFYSTGVIDTNLPDPGTDVGTNSNTWVQYEPGDAIGRIVLDQTGQVVARFAVDAAGIFSSDVLPSEFSGEEFLRPYVDDLIPEPSGDCLYIEQTSPVSIVDDAPYVAYNVNVWLSGDLETDPVGILLYFNDSAYSSDLLLRHITRLGHIYGSGFEEREELTEEIWLFYPDESGEMNEYYEYFKSKLKEKIRITNRDVLGLRRPIDPLVWDVDLIPVYDYFENKTTYYIQISIDPESPSHGYIETGEFYPNGIDTGHLNYNAEYKVQILPLDGWISPSCGDEYVFTFITQLFPMYCTVEIVRADLGAIAELVQDYEIAKKIHLNSLRAIDIYKGNPQNPYWNPNNLESAIPPGVIEYVCCKTELDILYDIMGGYTASGGGVSKKLADFSVYRSSKGAVDGLTPKMKDLQVCIKDALWELTWRGKRATAVKAAWKENRPGTPMAWNREVKNFEMQDPSGAEWYFNKYGEKNGPWSDKRYNWKVGDRNHTRYLYKRGQFNGGINSEERD